MLRGAGVMALACLVPVVSGFAALHALRSAEAPAESSGSLAREALARHLAFRAGRHLHGNPPPFLATMGEAMAGSLADPEAHRSFLASLHCGRAGPWLAASVRGVAWMPGAGLRFTLAPCTASGHPVTVTLAPGGPFLLAMRVVDAASAPP